MALRFCSVLESLEVTSTQPSRSKSSCHGLQARLSTGENAQPVVRAAAGVGSGCGGVEEGQHELIASNQASAGRR